MKGRAVSPAMSENEVDIAGSLFANDADSDNEVEVDKTPAHLDFGDLLNNGDSDDGEGDEAFISLQQRRSNRKTGNLQGKSAKKSGGFQAMGLNSNLLRAITRKGFSVPTPIQRKAIPLVLERRDVVGMARTGSGKTAAFVIPMIERLKAHSARVGARALIMSPSRELALQTLKVVKELGKGTDLKTVLLVGGDSLEEQFGLMAANPDIVIATPGRFLHLKVEMGLDLSSIRYVVFDEADRLFEMGFAAQLTEILHALPPSRQTLLFSATLPSSLVEFARAGLQEPSLVRLDAETKVSPDLESAFFSVKSGEKEGALLHILHDVIKMPLGLPEGVEEEADDDEHHSRKRKRGSDRPNRRERPTEHSTIIFTATKHHVEYIAHLLRHAGFSVSYVYGSLDQTARKIQVDNFRRGRTNILVVTDVAARGIDIPVLANVINYDFPPQPKIFVHRVGRTARAGQRGWAYALVKESDLPYLLDLQLFLGRKLVVGQEVKEPSYAQDVAVGTLMRAELENNIEWVKKVLGDMDDIEALRGVTLKAEKLYMRTRNSASSQSAKRAREVIASRSWTQLHPLFGESAANAEEARDSLLSKISGFKPQETVFEIGPQGKSAKNKAAEVMRSFRARVGPRRSKKTDEDTEMANVEGGSDDDDDDEASPQKGKGGDALDVFNDDDDNEQPEPNNEDAWEDDASDSELEVTVTSSSKSKKGQTSFEDPEIFMSYTPRTTSAAEERAYGVNSGGTTQFVEAARDAAMDLANDDGAKAFGLPTRSKMRWDKRHSKYVARANDDDGSRGAKMVRGESGVKIAASFQSGRFDKWRRANRLGRLPGVGETEKSNLVRHFNSGGPGGGPGGGGGGPRYKHKQEKAPKDADKFRDDYHVRKKRVAEAKEKRVGKYKDGEGSRRELKSAVDIRKARQVAERKREKNARPTKKARR
ncbi:P-loop containing nucleoside triphosphate hydrolase protein [Dichotomopilus funicola]|uniref:RNA helicase n=1 Tax=Dichotomopilus funicola TaxID=1934379 RepID=A0AAN6V993_9PEZI|nr:P-loop containing nucleoside triphosphate hydrolase protein [Dichotomopilus funicola]